MISNEVKEKDSDSREDYTAEVPLDGSDINPNMYLRIANEELTGPNDGANTGGDNRRKGEDLSDLNYRNEI